MPPFSLLWMLLSKMILKAGLYWEDFYRNLWPVRNMMVLSLEQWGKYGDSLNNFPVVCHPHITLMSQEPWERNSRVCNQVAEVCVPVLTQECLSLRWEGVHKISLTFITVNNILSGVVRGFLGLVVFFFLPRSSSWCIWWWCYQKSYENWLGSKSH